MRNDNHPFDRQTLLFSATFIQDILNLSGNWTCDPLTLDRFWLNDYAPEATAVEASRYPIMKAIRDNLAVLYTSFPSAYRSTAPMVSAKPVMAGPSFCSIQVRVVPIRLGASLIHSSVDERLVTLLSADLDSGEWDRRHGNLCTLPVSGFPAAYSVEAVMRSSASAAYLGLFISGITSAATGPYLSTASLGILGLSGTQYSIIVFISGIPAVKLDKAAIATTL